jgi:hypothetical protein
MARVRRLFYGRRMARFLTRSQVLGEIGEAVVCLRFRTISF